MFISTILLNKLFSFIFTLSMFTRVIDAKKIPAKLITGTLEGKKYEKLPPLFRINALTWQPAHCILNEYNLQQL
jgi:hypothetical protein